MSDVKPSPQFKLPPADLKKYLISLGWLDEESLPTKGEDRAKAMAPLLDLDLSVSIAQMLESPPVDQLVATDFALVGAQTDLLFETIQTAMDNYDFAIRHWERGRYRVLHGERLGRTLVSEGYGHDASNERWQRVGRLIWASAQEFVDTQFKRTRMKFRVVSDEQRPKLEAGSNGLRWLAALDENLLTAKRRRLEQCLPWVQSRAQAHAMSAWHSVRPALETKEALETLVADSGVGGWLDQSIQLSANVHRRLLFAEARASTTLVRGILSDEKSN